MTHTLKQIVSAMLCLSVFAGATRANMFFTSDIGSFDTLSTNSFMPGSFDRSSENDGNDGENDGDTDDQSMSHTLFPDQGLKVSVTLDAAPQFYHLELTAKPRIGHSSGHHDNNHGSEDSSNNALIDVGVHINGEFAGIITFDTVSNEWQTGWLDLGVLSGDVSITLDWLNPSPFEHDTFLKIRPLVFTTVVPTPATVMLMLTSFGFAAPRRRRG